MKLREFAKETAKLAGIGAISMLAGAYGGHKMTMNAVKELIMEYKTDAIKSEQESKRSSEEAERAADASQRATVSAITTRFSTSAQMCINLGQASPILMRHVQTVKPACETVDTIHNLITENKKVCEAALEVLTENEDILGKVDSKKEMIQHLEATIEEIRRMEMDPEFPKSCKKEKPGKKGMAL